MKNTIRNILAVLAATVALSNAAGAQEYSNIFAEKTATNNYDGTYTLAMQTYATGNQILVETRNSVDAVVILDLSSSMSSKIDAKGSVFYSLRESEDKSKPIYTLTSLLQENGDVNKYYIYWSDGKYYQLTGEKSKYLTFTIDGKKYGMNKDGSLPSGCTAVPDAYKDVVVHRKVNSLSRQSALSEAFSVFMSNLKVNQQEWNASHSLEEEKISHRVSIVYFNNIAENKITFDAGNVVENYYDIVTTVANFNRDDMTYAHLAFAKAKEVMASAREDASKACVFFTDGYPDDETGSFNAGLASEAIGYSLDIKNMGAKVYSMNVITMGEKDSETLFMDYVSSNFPKAASLNDPGTRDSNDYFAVTANQESLTGTFDAISKKIVKGGSEPKLDSSSYLLDIVSQYFMLPAGVEDASVKAYTNDLKSINGDEYSFGGENNTDGLTTSISGKEIKVTGFSYTDNFCGTHMTANGSGGYDSEIIGKRLVVEVTVVPDPDGANDDLGYSPTNDEDSGIYTEDGEVVKKFVTEPSAVFSEADLTVNVSGLAPGESAIFTIESGDKITLYGVTDYLKRTVVLTADSEGNASAVIKAPVKYKDGDDGFVKYTVTPTDWSWKYTVSPDSAKEKSSNISGSSISKALVKLSGSNVEADHTYEFKAAAKDTGVANEDEDAKQNVFQTHEIQ